MAFGVLFMVPFNAWKVHESHEINAAVPVLEQDLVRLGGDQLQGKYSASIWWEDATARSIASA